MRFRAYCSSANLGPGFDVAAVALDAFYDEVELRVEEGSGRVFVEEVSGPHSRHVSRTRNTAEAAVEHLLSKLSLDVDVYMKVWKGVPVGRGLGSSGATAAAAVGGVSKALSLEVPVEVLVEAAGAGEEVSAGSPHYDNVSASLLGGFVIIYSTKPLRVVRFEVDATFVLAVPKVKPPKGKTKLMREVLPKEVSVESLVHNVGRAMALTAGLLSGDPELAGRGMHDVVVEPARAPLIPCYREVREAALEAGALGVAVSGAGPSMLALVRGPEEASRVSKAVAEAYRRCGVEAETVVAKPAPGVVRVA